jgi:uncharacterized protein (TIGR03083 family)
MTLDGDELLGSLWRDGLALADAATRAGLDAPVPSCPEWSVADLVWHAGEVHDFWRTMVTEGWPEPSPYVQPDRPGDEQLVAWYRDGVQRTVEELRAAEPDAEVWTWAPRGSNVSWVVRRMAQETAVHRWDAEATAAARGDEPPPIDTALAADGIDEFFEHFTDNAAEGAAPVGGTVHLHCTDAEGEWLVSEPVAGGRLEVVAAHAKGDAAVRGTASDLLLLLWRRVDLDDVGRFEVFGDAAVAHRLVDRGALG